MAVTPRIEIKQSQSLLMTPQLRQAINLLQLSNVELNELLAKELEHNPFLEREDDRLADAEDGKAPTIDDYPKRRRPRKTLPPTSTATTNLTISPATAKATKAEATIPGTNMPLPKPAVPTMNLTFSKRNSAAESHCMSCWTNRFR